MRRQLGELRSRSRFRPIANPVPPRRAAILGRSQLPLQRVAHGIERARRRRRARRAGPRSSDVINSGTPPTREATTGVPHARASRTTLGLPSRKVGRTSRSAARYHWREKLLIDRAQQANPAGRGRGGRSGVRAAAGRPAAATDRCRSGRRCGASAPSASGPAPRRVRAAPFRRAGCRRTDQQPLPAGSPRARRAASRVGVGEDGRIDAVGHDQDRTPRRTERDGASRQVLGDGEDPVGAPQRARDGAAAQADTRQHVEIAAADGHRDRHAEVRRQQDRRRTVGKGVVGIDDVEGKFRRECAARAASTCRYSMTPSVQRPEQRKGRVEVDARPRARRAAR